MSDQQHLEHLESTVVAFETIVNTSIETSEQQEPHVATHIHTPSDHSNATSWVSRWIPTASIQRLGNRYHFGNYVVDRETGQKTFESMSIYVRLGMHLLYYGSYQQQVLQWRSVEQLLESQTIKMGKWYDSPESVSEIARFINNFGLWDSLEESKEPDPRKYQNFNDFFARELKDGARPIADPTNDLVSSSPADCRLTAFQTVDLATKYWIKGFGFSIEQLLGGPGDPDSQKLAQSFGGGSIVIARLAPQDHHRFYSPISGSVLTIKDIPGAYYTVNPQAINEAGTLDVYCQNRRSVMTLKHATTGATIALVVVGAMLVGSIKYNEGITNPGAKVERGDCLGTFYYGGSTVIVLYPKGEIAIDTDLARNSTELTCETYMKIGWRIGEKKSSL